MRLSKLAPNQTFKFAGQEFEYIGKRGKRCVVYGPLPNSSLRWMETVTEVEPGPKPTKATEPKKDNSAAKLRIAAKIEELTKMIERLR